MSGPTPETAALLARLDELGARPYAELGVLRARRSVDAATWMQGEREEVAEVRDLLVAGGAGRVPARLYHPDPGRVLPLVVHLHGGGWVAGGIAVADRPSRSLAVSSGCAVLSVGYRLAPETAYPGGLDDCVAAVRWAVAHAADLGVDPDAVAVLGDSAGGNLAAVTALRLRDEGGPRLAHQVLVYPMVAAPGDDFASLVDNAEGYQLGAADVRWFQEHYLAGGRDDPVGHQPGVAPLHAASLAGLPAATVVVAELDPLRDEGVAYAERLRADGVPTELVCWPGTVHGFMWMSGELSAGRELIDRLGARLRAVLARGVEEESG